MFAIYHIIFECILFLSSFINLTFCHFPNATCGNWEYNKKGVLEIFIIHAPSSLIKDPISNMMQMGVNY